MSKETAPAAAAAEAPAKKSSMVPMIAALVAGLAVGGGTGAFVVGPALAAGISPETVAAPHAGKKAKAKAADEGDESDSTDADDEEGDDEGDKKADKKGGEGEAAASSVYVIDNLVLNPSASQGTRFLLLTVAFEMKTPTMVDDMKARDAEVRDHVLNVVGAKTVDQLANMATRDSLKTELSADLAKLLKKKKAVKRIYFPQFVIQ